ncbi:MAG TPA: class I SAM-dependent methyltransferase [Mycobacteriales bacterium]|nr:class I SAM-dependent methyltransferase [Mycobacteriales bacterium]
MPRAQLDRQPREVAQMFDAVADHYDRMNAVMTGGQERRWRRIVAQALDVGAGDLVLDLAAGTGASSASLQTSGARVVACDFSEGMLGVGRRRHASVPFVAGDALRLPFRDATFSAVTVSFGLRNFADVDAALAELARVAAPEGKLAILETSAPRRQPMRAGHHFYVRRVMPRLARLVASNSEAYDYLAESMDAWPDPPSLADRIAAAGWGTVRWRHLMLGAVALHTATR